MAGQTLPARKALALLVGASGPSVRAVQIGDDYYTPAKLTVKAGTTLRWRWLADTPSSAWAPSRGA